MDDITYGLENDQALKKLGIIRPASRTAAAARRVPWDQMSNENLKFALDTLSLHQSPFEVDAANEIQRRIVAGTWLDIELPPPPLHELPHWLQIWPFRLLWKQRD
jgi:hypothetical protein